MSRMSQAHDTPSGVRLIYAACALAVGVAVGPAATSAPAQQQDAKASYARLCAACHGLTGHGDGPATAALTTRPASFAAPAVRDKTDVELARLIAEGKAPMPPFGKQLSASQIKALVRYIRELGKKPT